MREPAAFTEGIRSMGPAVRTRGTLSLAATALARWHALTSPPEPAATTSFDERERARRGRLASTLLLGVVALALAGLPTTFGHPLTVGTTLLVLAGSILALGLNRHALVTEAGLVMVLCMSAAVVVAMYALPNDRFDLAWLFAVPVLVAASLLPPLAVFPIVVVQCAYLAISWLLASNTPEMRRIIGDGDNAMIAWPIAMQIFVAVVAYLWVKNAESALLRADRAEEVAALQRREAARNLEEAERRRELEEGVGQIQAALVQLANGNFHARVPAVRDALLWRVGTSMNHFIGRMSRLAQADFTLQRTEEEARRLAAAIVTAREGRQPIWPVPSGTPLDRVIDALMGDGAKLRAPEAPPERITPPSPAHGASTSALYAVKPPTTARLRPTTTPAPSGSASGNPPLPSDLPDWLQPPTTPTASLAR